MSNKKQGSQSTTDEKIDRSNSAEPIAPKRLSNQLLIKRLAAIQAKAQARQKSRSDIEPLPDQRPPHTAARNLDPIEAKSKTSPTDPIRQRSRNANHQLYEMEQSGRFNTYPLVPNNQFPTLLTRLPIFRPTTRIKQKKMLDQDNALEFSTPFGSGRRHGPLLTVRDEDTLIAITRLRDRRLYGNATDLPIPIASWCADTQGKVQVHFVLCTVQDINHEKNLTNGGENYRATVDSIKRLAATSIELNTNRHERYFGEVEKGGTLRLLDVIWELYEKDGILLIQIPPIIAYWLEKEYTYLNWEVRLSLNDLGKSLHRFLSSQPRHYQGQVSRIAESIGYDGPSKNTKPRFREALEQMLKLKWLSSYRFTGTGRRQPLMLSIER